MFPSTISFYFMPQFDVSLFLVYCRRVKLYPILRLNIPSAFERLNTIFFNPKRFSPSNDSTGANFSLFANGVLREGERCSILPHPFLGIKSSRINFFRYIASVRRWRIRPANLIKSNPIYGIGFVYMCLSTVSV